MPRTSLTSASRVLAERDPALGAVIDHVGRPRLRPPRPTHFDALARAIVFQQLSGRAAATIYGRLELAAGSMTPEAVLALSGTALRGAGLSAAKAASVTDLAQRVLDGSLPLDDVHDLPDDALIERLVAVRGIGRWTAEMFLIFQLRRLDVWPVDDLGVRKGFARVHGLAALPTPAELGPRGEGYRPFRSVAAWYCWRATEISDLPG